MIIIFCFIKFSWFLFSIYFYIDDFLHVQTLFVFHYVPLFLFVVCLNHEFKQIQSLLLLEIYILIWVDSLLSIQRHRLFKCICLMDIPTSGFIISSLRHLNVLVYLSPTGVCVWCHSGRRHRSWRRLGWSEFCCWVQDTCPHPWLSIWLVMRRLRSPWVSYWSNHLRDDYCPTKWVLRSLHRLISCLWLTLFSSWRLRVCLQPQCCWDKLRSWRPNIPTPSPSCWTLAARRDTWTLWSKTMTWSSGTGAAVTQHSVKRAVKQKTEIKSVPQFSKISIYRDFTLPPKGGGA